MAATANEQLILELINAARLDPTGGTARYVTSYSPLTSNDQDTDFAFDFFNVSGSAFKSAVSALKSKAPLAFNDQIAAAARTHNQNMIAADSQSHELPGEGNAGARLTAAGYTGWSIWGENVYAFAKNMIHAHAGFFVDWGPGPGGMQSPAGHRANIMSSEFREIGIGVTAENNPGTSVGPFLVTEDFASRGSQVFVLGVVINDKDGDNFYDIGEGKGGVKIAVTGGGSDTSDPAGGYSVAVNPASSYAVTFSGGGLSHSVKANISGVTKNVKVDLLGSGEILSSTSTALSTGAEDLGLLGSSAINGSGTSSANIITGNKAANTLKGLSGNDTLKGNSGNDKLDGGSGRDVLTGGSGDDDFIYKLTSDTGKSSTTRDVIKDFTHLHDDIDLLSIDANGTSVAGNGTFKFLATKGAAFTGVKGQVHWYQSNPAGTTNDKTFVEGDTNGDKKADFQIELTGLKTLSISDFIL